MIAIVIDDWEFDCIPFFGNLRCEGYMINFPSLNELE